LGLICNVVSGKRPTPDAAPIDHKFLSCGKFLNKSFTSKYLLDIIGNGNKDEFESLSSKTYSI